MKLRRPLSSAAAAIAAAMLCVAAAHAPADAASHCKGNACTGKNPQTQGCGADAHDVPKSTVRAPGGGPSVRLRVSNRCSAAWARADKADHGWLFKIEIRQGKSYHGNPSPRAETYTAMVGTSHAYRACIQDVDKQWECSRWF
ncbi:DUF2690 domain-containing protein [Streptomyces sp. NPDC056304]|uniref:DUF2690 domain-containing protein n=1 Tax=Streptomyces sp. NPDC056304 TaxID=3345778 RepID=UPI0035DF71A5